MRKLMRKWNWLCPPLMMAVAVWIFTLLGFTVWAAVFMALLLVCPAIIIYALVKMTRSKAGLSPETLHTRGMPLDVLAPIYDRYCPLIGLGRAFRQTTIRYAELMSGDSVLDVGCGTGVLTRLAALAVGPTGYVIGIDPAAKMIGVAKKNAVEQGSQAEFRLAVIENLPFEENRFDCVLSSAMLHHLPPDVKMNGLSEVKRVLKPGGRLIVVDVDRPTVFLWWVILWPLLFWSFTEEQVKGRIGALMLRAGFSRAEKVGSWGGFLGFWKVYK